MTTYTRDEIEEIKEKGFRINFTYKGSPRNGKIVKTDFNTNFNEAYGVITIQESFITYSTDVENIQNIEVSIYGI